MPRNIYQLLLAFLLFADNSLYDPKDPCRDRLYKMRQVVDYFVTRFKSAYLPEEHVSID